MQQLVFIFLLSISIQVSAKESLKNIRIDSADNVVLTKKSGDSLSSPTIK